LHRSHAERPSPSALAGTRLLPLAVLSLLMRQSPLAALVTQLGVLVLTRDGGAHCASQLLSDRLSRQRLQWAAAALDANSCMLLSAPPLDTTGGGVAAAAGGLAHRQLDGPLTWPRWWEGSGRPCPCSWASIPPADGDSEAACTALVAFLRLLLALLLPTLASVYAWKPPAAPPGSHAGWRAALASAADAGDRLLWHALGGSAPCAIRAMLCCALCANSWLACKRFAGCTWVSPFPGLSS
jgi:hypothetical protein